MVIKNSEYFKKSFSPNSYTKKDDLELLRRKITDFYTINSSAKGGGKTPSVFLTENGRTALYLFLKSVGLPTDTKVAVQPFTCNSAVNPILWSGYEPKYIDIKRSNLSMDSGLFRKAVDDDPTIRVVIVQHTFGVPGEIKEIVKLCDEKDLILIEDCAHALGTDLNHQPLGTFGDVSFISFGLEKNLPTKVGGALLINNMKYEERVRLEYETYTEVTVPRTILWMKNPYIRVVSRKTGVLGAKMIEVFEKMGVFEVGFSSEEMLGGMPDRYPKKMSNPIAAIVLGYFDQINAIAQKRKEDSLIYNKEFKRLGYGNNTNPLVMRGGGLENRQEDLEGDLPIEDVVPFLKYPFFANDERERADLKKYLEDGGFYISNWYDFPIYPEDTKLDSLGYEIGSCPVAEKASKTVINLPTGAPFRQGIIEFISSFYSF